MSRIAHLVRTQGLGLLALLLVLTGGAAYAAGAAKDSVVSRSIKDGQVKTRDLKDNAVQTGKLAADSVNSDKLAPGSVTPRTIAPGSIPGDRLVHHSVSGAKITSNTVTGDKIPDESLTGFEIAPNSLFANDLATSSVGATELKGLHVVVSGGAAVPAGDSKYTNVACPAGEVVTGGGFAWGTDQAGTSIIGSSPAQTQRHIWEVVGRAASANTLYAWALCLPA